MHTSSYLTKFIAVALLSLPAIATASSDHDDHHGHDDHHEEHSDNLDAHVHGMANLSIAIEAKEIEISFTSPSEGIVGFEYVAKSHDEIHAVEHAEEHLSDGEELFEFDGADCELEHKQVDVSGLLAKSEHAKEEHGHDDHEDEHKDEHHDHDDHKDAHHDEHKESTHSEVTAEYHFACDSTEDLEHIEVNLINEFERIKVINVQWVSDAHQGSAKIDEDHDHIDLH